jgi:hypothetical protein
MNPQKIESLYLRKENNKVIGKNNTTGSINDSDWFVDVFLTKSINLNGYVQINRDNFTYEIDRQNINPFFYEIGFFQTIKKISFDEEPINYFFNIIQTGNTSEFNIDFFNSVYNVYKESIELKSLFYKIPISPNPVNNISATTVTEVILGIKSALEQNQKNFLLELSATTSDNLLINTFVIQEQGEYLFSDQQPVPINTKIGVYKNGKYFVLEGIYKNFEVFKTQTLNLEFTNFNP